MRNAIFAMLCLTAGIAFAQDAEDATSGQEDTVDLRVNVFEVIDVTAEKAPADTDAEVDTDILTILDEAEALEADASPE